MIKGLKIDLFGIPFDVDEVKSGEVMENHKDVMEGLNGRIMFDSQKIYIREGLVTDTRNLILLHEITHSILDSSGLYKEFEEAKMCTERVTELFSTHLFNVMVSNKEFFRRMIIPVETVSLKDMIRTTGTERVNRIIEEIKKENKEKI